MSCFDMFVTSFQGVCSAYDILIVRRLDVVQVLGLRTAIKNKSMPVVNARLKLSVSFFLKIILSVSMLS